MKVALGNTALAATLITNCVVAVAKDSGYDLSDAMQDQIQTIAVTVVGLALTWFVQRAHDLMKAHKESQISSLESNQPNSTVHQPK